MVLVRLFHEDRNLRIRILLDASRSMEAKLDQAGTLAAGLALVGLAHRDSVELATAPWRAPVAGNDLQALPAVLAWLEPIVAGTRNRCGARSSRRRPACGAIAPCS
jgi:uncharacterized protein (DUF58 family)